MAGEDKEFGKVLDFEGKQVKVNSALYGYENAMNHIVTTMKEYNIVPINVILVREGKDSKEHRKYLSSGAFEYKGTRSTRPPEAYAEFNTLNDMLCDALCNVGASVATQDGIEADDVIAYLAQNLQGERYILTSDGDLAALITSDVHLIRNGELDPQPFGPIKPRWTPIFKALVGDSSDNIPGVKGFGPKAFLDLFVSLTDEDMDYLLECFKGRKLHTLQSAVAEHPQLKKVLEQEMLAYKSFECACLYPQLVNTLRRPLVWRVGRVSTTKDERLKQWAAANRLVHAGNYEQAVAWARQHMNANEFVALDIETSTPEVSDEWLTLAKRTSDEDKVGVDVLGSYLVSMGVTFGDNLQYTFYLTHKHKEEDGVPNLTQDQMREFCELINPETKTLIQNFSFESAVLYNEWGDKWADNGWEGFLPNCRDTKIYANYVNENISAGLKQGSKYYLNYDQVTYKDATTIEGVQYKMHQLTAKHVYGYGADDPRCTADLYVHFRRTMEIEKTWDVCEELETYSAYLTAHAFVRGVKFDMKRMVEMRDDDQATMDKAWETVSAYLIKKGWEGTQLPVFVEADMQVAAQIKLMHLLITGEAYTTRKSKFATVVAELKEMENPTSQLLGTYLEAGNLEGVNELVKRNFTGKPKFDMNSPKQVKHFLYNVMGLQVRLVNKCTPTEKAENKPLYEAVSLHRQIAAGSGSTTLTEAQIKLLIDKKARTDDTSIDFALAFDNLDDERRAVLKALQAYKTCDTRFKMFYRPYEHIKHWKSNKVHPSFNQCATVTRRYTSSTPNAQQLPKRGEGVKFRECFLPHNRDSVLVSVDFAAQEIRLQAGLAEDKELMSCYVGENLKDFHSITASSAMQYVWTKEERTELLPAGLEDYDAFNAVLHGNDKKAAKKAKDLRTLAKWCNFGSSYGCEPPKMQEILIVDLPTATNMLEAKRAKFWRYEQWKEEVEAEALDKGYAVTELGGIRHLQHAVMGGNKWEAQKAARQASNFMIQGAGGELAKAAMTKLWKSGALAKYDMEFVFMVHDELVVSVNRADALNVIRIVHESVSQPYTADFPVPFVGSISLGPNFGKQEELGEVFDAEKIEAALVDLFSNRD